MQNNTYTISELSKTFNESKQVVRRRIDNLNIESINRDTRAFPNEPLEYDFKSYKKLADSFGVNIEQKTSRNDTQQDAKIHDDETQNKEAPHDEKLKSDKIIEILDRELQHAKEKLTKSEEEKEHLYRLLDQQQQLTLTTNKRIELLETEIEEKGVKEERGWFKRLFN